MAKTFDLFNIHYDQDSSSYVGSWKGTFSQSNTESGCAEAVMSSVILLTKTMTELECKRDFTALEQQLLEMTAERDKWKLGFEAKGRHYQSCIEERDEALKEISTIEQQAATDDKTIHTLTQRILELESANAVERAKLREAQAKMVEAFEFIGTRQDVDNGRLSESDCDDLAKILHIADGVTAVPMETADERVTPKG